MAQGSSQAAKPCKDCLTEGRGKPFRAAPHPGPRCVTHWRIVKKDRKARAHEQHVQRTYDLKPGEYDKLYAAQNGLCYICGPRTGHGGHSRRMPVDHDHATGEVRGLLCGICNDILGRWRDDPLCFARGFAYLLEPPARRILNAGPMGLDQ
jgi:hypothetical protein